MFDFTLQFVVFVVVAYLFGSSDGVQWQPEPVHTNWRLLNCNFLDGSFWLVGLNGTILQSDSIPLSLKGSMLANNGGYELTISGLASDTARLQVRTNIAAGEWSDLITLTNDQYPLKWVDANTTSNSTRFYRAVSP